MRREFRGLQGIRTMGALVDNRRARTPGGALLELSALANEKLLLERELTRWKHRHAEIKRRLREIRAKEEKLLAVAQVSKLDAASTAEDHSSAEPKASQSVAPDRRLRTTEFQY